MAFDLTPPVPPSGEATRHHLPATPATCYWGYIDRDQPAVLEIDSGDIVARRGGHAPRRRRARPVDGRRHPRDLGGDRRSRRAGPGVHIMTGPIHVRGAAARRHAGRADPRHDAAPAVRLELRRQLGAALRRRSARSASRSTGSTTGCRARVRHDGARPLFGFDFTARPLYDVPGVITEPDLGDAPAVQPAGRSAGAPALRRDGRGAGRAGTPLVSIPPGVFGGNVDNWRFGPGATMCYPVFVDGADLYVGDPHFAQGDGEICGTAIEASLDATIQVFVVEGDGHRRARARDRHPLVHARLRRRPRRGDARWPPNRCCG